MVVVTRMNESLSGCRSGAVKTRPNHRERQLVGSESRSVSYLLGRLRHESLNVFELSRKILCHPFDTGFGDQHIVFDTHADVLISLKYWLDRSDERFVLRCVRKIFERVFANVNSGFVRVYHSRGERNTVASHVMDVHSEPVSKSMDEPD